ncbi:MAG: protein translocase subunit SecD [Chloroflexi bacterium]|nr:protein translocase subunit SecD [Chloroflexota bacterium]
MHRVRNNLLALLGIALIVAVAAWIVFGGNRTENILGGSLDLSVKEGLDLQGGYQILLQARDNNVTADRLQAARQIIEKRVNGLGTNEPSITIQGNNRISVELPGVTDENAVKKAIGSTGRLEFIDAGTTQLNTGDTVQTTYCTTGSLYQAAPNLCGTGVTSSTTATSTTSTTPSTPSNEAIGPGGTPGATTPGATTGTTPGATATAATTPGATTAAAGGASTTPGASPTVSATATPAPGKLNASNQPFQTVITGDQLDPAKIDIGFADTGGGYKVLFGVKADATNTFSNFTSQHLGQQMAIVLDGQVISAATIQGVISNQGEITSPNWQTAAGKADAQNLVLQLKYGSLPVQLDVIASRKVGATLGTDSIDRSLIAGIVGLGIVAAFMILYFRLPGLLAVFALVIYSIINFALFKLLGVVLTLAGIAGFILSIGMAVDANVLIFARMKEELRLGRSIERAVEEGFRNAWPSIRDSNISTLITCGILYWFGDFTGTSTIKGFALTLAIGVLCSMFTAITVTHTFLRLMFLITGSQRHLTRGGWWFGMNRTRRQAEEVQQV